jgi:hypothetical protein
MSPAASTYRGWAITKTDTGGRRLGREVWYWATSEGGDVRAHLTLKGLRAIIDIVEAGRAQLAAGAPAGPCVQCAECGRRFDLGRPADADEWTYGHDCEAA